MFGGAGDDTITGSADSDYLYGDYAAVDHAAFPDGAAQAWDPAIVYPAVASPVFPIAPATTGNDTMYGGYGFDDLFGGPGDDVMYANKRLASTGEDIRDGAPDRLWGQGGNDTYWGGWEANAALALAQGCEAADDADDLIAEATKTDTSHHTRLNTEIEVVHNACP